MIRKATAGELTRILEIYDIARAYMRANGNMTQWVNGYPQEALVSRDIADGNLYVLADEDGEVHAVFGIYGGDDPTYAYIDGCWASDTPYAAIHRVASDGRVKGVFKKAFEFAAGMHSHLRIDTHADNVTMQKAVEKCGFVHRGTIYLADGAPRLAYEWEK